MDMTFEAWWDTYQPIKNKIDKNASFDGHMYETFGLESDYIYAVDPKFVWTYMDFDSGYGIASGRHFVNRIGYFVTRLPWTEGVEVLMGEDEPTCYECGEGIDDVEVHEGYCEECYKMQGFEVGE